jgi:hypothetical protein
MPILGQRYRREDEEQKRRKDIHSPLLHALSPYILLSECKFSFRPEAKTEGCRIVGLVF